MTEEPQIPVLREGEKEFILGINEEGENKFFDKCRLDKETIIVLDAIEEAKIARFTIINNLWTEVSALEKEQEASLGHVTIQVVEIEKNFVRFLLK